MTLLRSIVSASVAAIVGAEPAAVAGAVNVLPCQSSRKNPIVLATGGSTGAIMVTVVSGEPGPVGGAGLLLLFFLQKRPLVSITAIIINLVFIKKEFDLLVILHLIKRLY